MDFNEAFAPMAKFIIIRYILAIAAAMDLKIHRMNVNATFLNGMLEAEMYMDQSKGFVQESTLHLVCKIKKTLYGLKQSLNAQSHQIDMFFVK